MLSNTRNLNDRRTHHTPGHNPFMEITLRCYQKNHQLTNWINILRKYFRKLWEIFILFQIHRPHNVDVPKLPGGGTYKVDSWNRKTNNWVYKLQRNTSRRNNRIQKKRNDSLHIYSDASYISELEAWSRARGYFFLRPKSKTLIQ